MEILREYLENEMQITEYTKDRKTVSHKISVPVQSVIPPGEVIPVPPTFSQQIAELQNKNNELESALVEMSSLTAEQEMRNIQNEQAIMELTILVGGNV